MKIKLFILLLVFSFIFPIFAEKEVGEIKTTDSMYAYISKFCFAKGTGFLNISLSAASSYNQKVGLISQSKFKLLNNKLTCTQIENLASQTFPMDSTKNLVAQVKTNDVEWWFLVGFGCENKVSFTYDIEWTNSGGFWQKQFSYDEQGLGQLYICFTVFYSIVLGLHIYGVIKLVADKSYHDIVRMLTIAFVVELLATFLMSIHYGIYAKNGVGLFSFLFIGQILDLAGDLLMILSVTLIAQGYAKNSMSVKQQKITFLILAVNLVIYVAMDIWKIAGISHSSINYLYDTAPGGIILAIRMLLLVYFIYAIIMTIREEQIQKKINFFVKFAIFVSVWFIFLPFCALIALGMADYKRLVFISAVFTLMDFLGFVGLGILMWPTFIHDFFVVRQVDTHIDFSENEDRDDSFL